MKQMKLMRMGAWGRSKLREQNQLKGADKVKGGVLGCVQAAVSSSWELQKWD